MKSIPFSSNTELRQELFLTLRTYFKDVETPQLLGLYISTLQQALSKFYLSFLPPDEVTLDDVRCTQYFKWMSENVFHLS